MQVSQLEDPYPLSASCSGWQHRQLLGNDWPAPEQWWVNGQLAGVAHDPKTGKPGAWPSRTTHTARVVIRGIRDAMLQLGKPEA